MRCAALACALAIAPWTQAATPQKTPDFTGVWMIEKPVESLQPDDGSAIPLTAAARQVHDQHVAMRRQGDNKFDLTTLRCASPGAVRLMTLPYAVEFVQRPHQLSMLFEWNHVYRLINLRDEPMTAPYPMAIGISNGHWDGNTLVIETTSIADNTLLDSSGLPHSLKLRVTEKLRLLGRNRLEDLITVHDPETFTRDWTARLHFRKTSAKGIEEDVCLDRLDAGKPAIDLQHR
jgi:hypothetical protein